MRKWLKALLFFYVALHGNVPSERWICNKKCTKIFCVSAFCCIHDKFKDCVALFPTDELWLFWPLTSHCFQLQQHQQLYHALELLTDFLITLLPLSMNGLWELYKSLSSHWPHSLFNFTISVWAWQWLHSTRSVVPRLSTLLSTLCNSCSWIRKFWHPLIFGQQRTNFEVYSCEMTRGNCAVLCHDESRSVVLLSKAM